MILCKKQPNFSVKGTFEINFSGELIDEVAIEHQVPFGS